jgi:hypothetical protein
MTARAGTIPNVDPGSGRWKARHGPKDRHEYCFFRK